MYPSLMQKVFDLLSWKKTTTDTTIPALQSTDANLQAAIEQLSASLLDKIYPVGSVYMSFTNKSPAEFLGGTWEALADGRVLLSAGADYLVNSIGGFTTSTANISVNAHTLTEAEIPSHRHILERPRWYSSKIDTSDKTINSSEGTIYWSGGATTSPSYNGAHNIYTTGSSGAHTHGVTITEHNNMQPYRAVYMWRRTA